MLTTLQIFDDGHRRDERLLDGDAGTEQAMGHMLRFARRDAASPDLRKFVLKEVVGKTSGHNQVEQVRRCFFYARDRIVYERDPFNVERVSDIWSALYALNPEPSGDAEGDCGIKSVFLATALACLGFAPEYVTIKQTPRDNGFTHVYVGVRIGNAWTALDPTPPREQPGWKPNATQVRRYAVFQ